MAGIFVSRGMTVSIQDFTIVFKADGSVKDNLFLHVWFDVCPTWIELSLKHLQEAKLKQNEREAAWAGTDENQKALTLEREFEASMQAIMASATAIDAFYSLIKTHVTLPPGLEEKWSKNRTSRYKQISEVLRRAFNLKPIGAKALRQNLKEIYRLRDLTVHPSGKIEAPILHPELNVRVEWRFAYFRAHNAELIVNAATWILWNLTHSGTPKNSQIANYITTLSHRLEELFPNGHPNSL